MNESRERRDDCDQLGGLDRFRQVHRIARVQEATAIFRTRIGSQRRGGHIATTSSWQRTHFPDQIVTILQRHTDIGQKDIRYTLRNPLHRFRNTRSDRDIATALLENRRHKTTSIFIIIDDENTQTTEMRRMLELIR